MRIGEVATRANVSVGAVRLYEAEGLLGARARPGGVRAHRRYDEATVAAVRRIRNAQALGLSLREVRVLLGPYGDDGPDAEAMCALLESVVLRVAHRQAWLARAARLLRVFERYSLHRERAAAELAAEVVERFDLLGHPDPVPAPPSPTLDGLRHWIAEQRRIYPNWPEDADADDAALSDRDDVDR